MKYVATAICSYPRRRSRDSACETVGVVAEAKPTSTGPPGPHLPEQPGDFGHLGIALRIGRAGAGQDEGAVGLDAGICQSLV